MNNQTVTENSKKKAEMNRKEYFEYKKNRVLELARMGASVGDMAQDFEISLSDMYAFLSRNFGGIEKVKEAIAATPQKPRRKRNTLVAASAPQTPATDTKANNKPAKIAKAAKAAPITSATPDMTEVEASMAKAKDLMMANLQSEINTQATALIKEMETGFMGMLQTMTSEMRAIMTKHFA